MRLRVLALPTMAVGPYSHTPYVLIIDQCSYADLETFQRSDEREARSIIEAAARELGIEAA